MARRPVQVTSKVGPPVEMTAVDAKRLVTIDVPMGGLGAMRLPNTTGAYVRLRPMHGATRADMDTVSKSIGDALVVLKMPIAPTGSGVLGEAVETEQEAPMQFKTETLADALTQACEHVLDQDGVRDEDDRAAVMDAALDTLRKVGV